MDIKKFSDAMMKVNSNAEKEATESAERIQSIIENTLKIFRFIDDKIEIQESFGEGMRPILDYYNEKGILVYSDNRDGERTEEIKNPDYGMFPEEPEFFEFRSLVRQGFDIYLLRTGKLLRFEREGTDIPPSLPGATVDFDDLIKMNKKLTNAREVRPSEIANLLPDFEEQFYNNFKIAIATAIHKNPHKRAILQPVIDLFKQYKGPEGDDK